jgi:hypothetical protein
VVLKTLVIKFLSSKDQLVDVITKPLVSARFNSIRHNLTVCYNSSKLRELIEIQAQLVDSKTNSTTNESINLRESLLSKVTDFNTYDSARKHEFKGKDPTNLAPISKTNHCYTR